MGSKLVGNFYIIFFDLKNCNLCYKFSSSNFYIRSLAYLKFRYKLNISTSFNTLLEVCTDEQSNS